MLINSLISEQRDNPHIAVIDGNKQLTYQELYTSASRLAETIRKLDIYSPIGLFLPNCIEYVIGYFAVSAADCVIVPIRPQSTFFEICKVVEHCEVAFILTLSSLLPVFQAEEENLPSKLMLLCIDTDEIHLLNQKKEFCRATCDMTVRDEDSPALFLQTSGTTSSAKTVMLTHKNLVSNTLAVAQSFGLTNADRTLIQMPLQLSSGNIQMLTHLAVGATCVLNNQIFSPKLYFRLLDKYHITNFCCVTYMLQSLLHTCDLNLLKDLRFIGVGAGKTSPVLLKKGIEENKDITFIVFYGQTEASPRVSHMFMKGQTDRVDSAGKELPGISVEIRDRRGQPCGPNEEGIVFVKGDNVMKGYFKNPSATQEALKDGWLNTGDIGLKDEEGYLYIKGRSKNVIISNGNNIYPEEVEEVITQFPGVEEAVVYGVPHPDYQEMPEAKIVVSRDVSIQELQSFCLARLSGFKIPRRFHICESLEKTPTGKIKRERLRNEHGQG